MNDFDRRRSDFDRQFARTEKIINVIGITIAVVTIVTIISGIIGAAYIATNLNELGEYLIRLKSA